MSFRLGLLETDVLYDDLRADYGSYGRMFEGFFRARAQEAGLSIEFKYYQVQQGDLPADFDECDLYLITGSKAGVYDEFGWIVELTNWIQQAYAAQARMLGICFGHQILAHSLGGFADKSEKGWGIGVRSLDSSPSAFESPLPKTLSLIYSHQDQVQQLPKEAQVLLGDDFCPYAGFHIKDQVLAFQGHPEFDAEYTRRLLGRRADAIGEPTFTDGMETLNEATDAEWLGRWILNFFFAPTRQSSEAKMNDAIPSE